MEVTVLKIQVVHHLAGSGSLCGHDRLPNDDLGFHTSLIDGNLVITGFGDYIAVGLARSTQIRGYPFNLVVNSAQFDECLTIAEVQSLVGRNSAQILIDTDTVLLIETEIESVIGAGSNGNIISIGAFDWNLDARTAALAGKAYITHRSAVK